MASGNAVLQTIANSLIASPLDVSGATITPQGSFAVGHLTTAGTRTFAAAPAGTAVILINTSGSTIEIGDHESNTVLGDLLNNEAALCISVGPDRDVPWVAVVLKSDNT